MLKFSETTTVGKGHVLNMDNFIDTTNIEGRFEFSEWVRAYGKYLDEQLEVYQKINFYQVCLSCFCFNALCQIPQLVHLCAAQENESAVNGKLAPIIVWITTTTALCLDHLINCSVMLQ